jgi:hypothetical protein
MKKRLLSALLALALVFVLLPTTALAETPAIKIAGTVIEDGKYYYTNGGIGELKTEAQQKTWNVRRDGNTLYLKNAKINTTDTQSIQVWMMSVTINLEGDSTITTKGEGSIVSQFAGSLTIKGNGKLTIESNTAGSSIFWNSGDVTITGDAVVNITNKNSGQLSEAIGLTNSYELTVSGNAKLKAVSNGSKAATVNSKKLTIADNAEFNVINQNSSGKAVSFKSIEVATGYDCNGINGNGITDWTKTTAEELNTFQKVWVKPTPTPTLEKSNVCVAGTNLYKNTAYTIQDGKPVMGGTYPGNYNIYLDATGSNYVLHVKDAVIDATGTTGIYGTSNIVFEGTNSITASSYGIYSYFTSSDLKISGTGSLTVKTKASCPAIATVTNYTPKPSIEISGQGFTVTADTSGTTSPAITSAKDLTVKDGVTVKAASNATRAIDITGNLTVNSGATLTATSKSDNVPTVQVGGNASFTGSTVTITNHSDRQGKSGEYSYAVSTGLYVGGTLDIKNAAKVTSTVIGGNAIYAKGDITISGDSTEVNAQNSAYKFSAISTNGTVNISDNSTVKAENLKRHQGDPTGETDPSTGKTYNACPAITGKIANKNTQNKLHIAGFTTSSAGSQNPTEETPLNRDIAPSSVEPYIHHYKVTITRGDEVARTQSPVVIAGTTLLNDTYYTITNGSTVAEGTESNYNAFYNSTTKTLKLNNAKISTTTENAAIEIGEDSTITTITVTGTNELKGNHNHCIESYDNFTINGTGTLNMTNTNSSSSATSVIHCGPGKSLTIAAEVIIKNEAKPGNLIFTVKKDAYSFAEGYNVYASTDVSGSPLETYDAAKSSTYKYLRVTTQTLETGGGSTHQHVWDEAWHDTGDYHHAHQCTICKAYDTTTQEPHNVTGHRDNHDGSHSNICGSCGYSAKVSHSYTWAPNANDNEKHIGTCVCGNVVERYHNFVGDVCSDCGYDKSTGTTCKHVWTTEWTIDTVDNEYHWHKCIKCNAITDKKPHAYTIVTDSGTNHIRECECKVFYVEDHISSDWIIDTPATATTAGSMHKECTVCKHKMQTEVIPATGEIEPPTPDNPGTIVIIRPAEEEKPAQQPNPSTGANDLVGLAVAAAVAAALGSAALLRKHD